MLVPHNFETNRSETSSNRAENRMNFMWWDSYEIQIESNTKTKLLSTNVENIFTANKRLLCHLRYHEYCPNLPSPILRRTGHYWTQYSIRGAWSTLNHWCTYNKDLPRWSNRQHFSLDVERNRWRIEPRHFIHLTFDTSFNSSKTVNMIVSEIHSWTT